MYIESVEVCNLYTTVTFWLWCSLCNWLGCPWCCEDGSYDKEECSSWECKKGHIPQHWGALCFNFWPTTRAGRTNQALVGDSRSIWAVLPPPTPLLLPLSYTHDNYESVYLLILWCREPNAVVADAIAKRAPFFKVNNIIYSTCCYTEDIQIPITADFAYLLCSSTQCIRRGLTMPRWPTASGWRPPSNLQISSRWLKYVTHPQALPSF